jgi:DinB family protein
MPERRPQRDEYAPHHSSYIELVSAPVLTALRNQRGEIERLRSSVAEDRAGFRYQPEKWSIREVVGHLSDAERVYGYRAMALARNDGNPLPKYDPDGYVAAALFDARTMGSLIDEFLAVREGTIQFFENLPSEAWSRRGTMGGNPLSVRALAFIAVGHVARHLNVLRERYAVPPSGG